MKHNLPNSCKYLIDMNKFIFSNLMIVKWLIGILCCMMIIPVTAYAQSETDTVQIEQEQYILKRTGDMLVKIFGNVDDVYAKILLTHTTPNGESLTHNVMITSQGYYEFYFVHTWDSMLGNYEIFVTKDATPIGTVSYELIRDPSYKTGEQVKEEYFLKENDSNAVLEMTDNRWDFLVIEAEALEGSKIITITGHAKTDNLPVLITVLSPNRNLVSIDQISPDASGSFTSIISIGGPMWKQDGVYSIIAQQGSDQINKTTVEVEIVDGAVIPEFGTITSLVLVVAISSIIILSTKGKLRFQMR